MRRLVLCLFVACTYQTAGSPQPARPADAPQRRAGDPRVAQAVTTIARSYDQVLDGLADGDALVTSAHWEDASKRYRAADDIARPMLAWFANPQNTLGRGPAVRYATRHDGALDEAQLVANLRAASTHAQQGVADAFDHVVEKLANELGATSPGQRAALRQHGRPDAIEKHKKETCWVFHAADLDETFCWGKGGVLARHDKQPKAAPAVAWQPAPQPAAVDPAPSQPATQDVPASSGGGGGSTTRIAWWKKAGDCKAMINKNDFYCESGDCKALVNNNDFYCDSGDCKALVNKNDFYCTSGDCKALVNKNDFYCETGDCKALVNKNDFYCESQGCKAVVNNNDFYCE